MTHKMNSKELRSHKLAQETAVMKKRLGFREKSERLTESRQHDMSIESELDRVMREFSQ